MLSAVSSSIDAALRHLQNEVSLAASKCKEEEARIDDQELVNFLENDEMIQKIRKEAWINIRIVNKSKQT